MALLGSNGSADSVRRVSDVDLSEPWTSWSSRRLPFRGTHLDSAAAGRSSEATLAASAAHARLEAEVGGYVAQEQASEQIESGRATLAGLLGVPTGGLAFVASGSAGLDALLRSWPLDEGDTVGVAAPEWGPNLEAFSARGLRIVELAVHHDGAINLDTLERRLHDDPPTLIHLTQVTSHRSLIQPVAAAARVCAAAGVPLWVDAAQALGQVDTATGADAVYAVSRKWLTGPRGIGLLGIAERHWDTLRVLRPAMMARDLPPVAYLEPHEAHVAGRVGLAVAASEYVASGPERVTARLAEVGRLTRAAVSQVPGWAVVGAGTGAITAIRPCDGQDVAATRARLLAEYRVLTTACGPARAPLDLAAPVLRISAHVDCTGAALERLCDGLRNS